MKKIKSHINILFVVFGLFVSFNLFSQSADITKGCSPLEVNFETSDLSQYYWEFVEGNATSTLKNPIHIFTHPGKYDVKLYEGKDGKYIGKIEIVVYENPIIDFQADTTHGCTPLTVAFTSQITLDPEIKILDYNWAFGDGETSSEKNPIHIYDVAGEFKVSLELITDIVQCDEIYSIEKYIKTNDLFINFVPSTNFICDNEGMVKFKNFTIKKTDNTYFWDFGNGDTSTQYNPDSVHFKAPGNYTITLEVRTPEGCIYTKKKTITIGKPIFDLKIPDVGCIFDYYPGRQNDSTLVVNNTIADSFEWHFSPLPDIWDTTSIHNTSGIVSNYLNIVYNEGGIKTLSLRAYGKNGCYSDTTFTIFIEDHEPVFTIEPEEGCDIPAIINYDISDTTFAVYDWRFRNASSIDPKDKYSGSIVYNYPYKDSLYWKIPENVIIGLDVVTKNGCLDYSQQIYIHYSPNAHFAPDVAQGCAPLKVIFSDSSQSKYPIIKYKYLYGTGDSTILSTNADHSYTFTDPGDYFVKLIIETETGCIDTSAGEWIRVGEPIMPDYEVDKTEICLGDSVNIIFKNDDPRIDATHVYTDGGRYNECWKNKNKSHVFNTLPGEYPVIAVVEYNGCYVHDTSEYIIKVKGAKADLGYIMDCASPNTVNFIDRSTNADKLIWTVDGDTIFDKTDFSKYFQNTGDYIVKLEAVEIGGGCPSTIDSAKFKITNIEAKLDVPAKVCAKDIVELDGSKSVDVMGGCSLGYTWDIGNGSVPRRCKNSSISLRFPRGKNSVKLIVEDVNGCKDTIVKHIRSYGMKMDIALDKEAICLPATINVTNNSIGDTTLFWEWFDGSTDKEPILNIEDSHFSDFKLIYVRAHDALGCHYYYSKEVPLYKPKSFMSIVPDNSICIGDELNFYGSDFNDYGSHLNFNWILEGIDTFTQKENSVVIDSAGTYKLKYHFTEVNSGCYGDSTTIINVYKIPEANFYTDVDSLPALCYPQIITFMDSSKIYGPGYVKWAFKDVSLANNSSKTQVLEFPKGKHKATLVAKSYFGCADTISKYFEIVGPEGEVVTDKFSICKGDTIRFELINPVDVNSYKWDFGDGITISDQNPIKHVFDRVVDTTDAKIILKSAENCEISIDIPLLVNQVVANFEKIDTSLFCNGHAYLRNLSIGANKYIWSTNGEVKDSTEPVFVVYPSSGVYDISLKAINTINNCKDEITKAITLDESVAMYAIPNVFTPNGDGENDTFGPIVTNENFEGSIEFKTFKVYNRWGNLVYNNENPDVGWDGNFEGVEAPSGVYAYYLNVEIDGCNTVSETGNITLIR